MYWPDMYNRYQVILHNLNKARHEYPTITSTYKVGCSTGISTGDIQHYTPDPSQEPPSMTTNWVYPGTSHFS